MASWRSGGGGGRGGRGGRGERGSMQRGPRYTVPAAPVVRRYVVGTSIDPVADDREEEMERLWKVVPQSACVRQPDDAVQQLARLVGDGHVALLSAAAHDQAPGLLPFALRPGDGTDGASVPLPASGDGRGEGLAVRLGNEAVALGAGACGGRFDALASRAALRYLAGENNGDCVVAQACGAGHVHLRSHRNFWHNSSGAGSVYERALTGDGRAEEDPDAPRRSLSACAEWLADDGRLRVLISGQTDAVEDDGRGAVVPVEIKTGRNEPRRWRGGFKGTSCRLQLYFSGSAHVLYGYRPDGAGLVEAPVRMPIDSLGVPHHFRSGVERADRNLRRACEMVRNDQEERGGAGAPSRPLVITHSQRRDNYEFRFSDEYGGVMHARVCEAAGAHGAALAAARG